MIIKNAQVFREDGSFEYLSIKITGSSIEAVGNVDDFSILPNEEVFDADGLYAIPGLVDMHFHGCMGHDFCEGTTEAFDAIAAYEASQGVTSICPATMTLSEDTLLDICKAAALYKENQDMMMTDSNQNFDKAFLCGINLEGPFISMEKKGAQNPAFVREPDIDMFLRLYEASKGLVKTIAIAPEVRGAMEFIDALKDKTVISLAHTAADYDTAAKALSRGARHATHLYNAMSGLSHRQPGVVGAACENENCHAELICDGIHIHPATIKATFKMFGKDRMILISDSMEATGMPDGRYSLGGLPVNVKGHLAALDDGTIAGSATNLMDCMCYAVEHAGIPFGTAVQCASVNPAKEIGIYDRFGSIDEKKTANIVLLDRQLQTKAIFLNGKQLVSSPALQ